MNRDCDRFVDLLTDTAIAPSDEAFFADHQKVCSECRELKLKHDRLADQLSDLVSLPENSKNKVFSKIQSKIAEQKKSQSQPTLSFLNTIFSNFRPLLAVAAVLLVAGLILLLNRTETATAITITGNGIMMVAQHEITVSSTPQSLQPGEAVSLQQGEICLNWQKQEMMSISGTLTFTAEDRAIRISRGKASIDFKPSAVGYRVSTPNSLLHVIGTTVKFDITEKSEKIEVVKGKISWSLPGQGKGGILEAGNGIQIISGNNGIMAEALRTDGSESRPEAEPEKPKADNTNLNGGAIQEPVLHPDANGYD